MVYAQYMHLEGQDAGQVAENVSRSHHQSHAASCAAAVKALCAGAAPSPVSSSRTCKIDLVFLKDPDALRSAFTDDAMWGTLSSSCIPFTKDMTGLLHLVSKLARTRAK